MRLIKCFLLLCVVVLGGCQVTYNSQNNLPKAIPNKFSNSDDTLINCATYSYNAFFNDTLLIDLIDTAIKNNNDLLMAIQKVNAVQAEHLLAKGTLSPNVSAGIIPSVRKFGLYTMDGAGNIVTEITPNHFVPIHLPDYYLGFQSSWEIDIWGKLKNQKASAFSRYLASLEGRNLVLTNIVSEIALTYYDLIALDNTLNIVKESILIQENALKIIYLQKQAGTTNELAVKQFEAQVFNTKSFEVELNQMIVECENKINFLLGRYPQKIKRSQLSFFLDQDISIQPNVGIPSDLLQNRPDIRQASYNLLATKANLNSAKAAFYPSLNITAGLGLQAFDPTYLFITPQSITYNIISNLTAPIINKSAIKSRFQSAKASQMEALINYQKCVLNGYIEVYNQINYLASVQQSLTYKKNEVESLSQAIDVSITLFKANRATYLEVLLAQQQALKAKLNLIEIKKNQYNCNINLYKALGGGWKIL